MDGAGPSSGSSSSAPRRKSRYAQIVMGLKGNGKSTYCNKMVKYAASKGRRFRVINLDPSVGTLAYENPIADIRDKICPEEFSAVQEQSARGQVGQGFDYVLKFILENPGWLFGAIDEANDVDHFLFDCPGEDDFHAHLGALKVFVAMLVVKSYRICSVFIRDARLAVNGYSFICSSLTPLTSYVNLAIPHLCVMMKFDLLNDEEKSKIHLFINSDIKDVLRYENAQRNPTIAGVGSATITPIPPPGSGPAEIDHTPKYAAIACAMLDGHSLIRKKYYPLDITEDGNFKNLLSMIDDVVGINSED